MTELYWITRLDAIHAFLTAVIIICILVIITSLIGWIINHGEDETASLKCKKNCYIYF